LIIVVNGYIVILRWGTIPPWLKPRGFLYPYTHDFVIQPPKLIVHMLVQKGFFIRREYLKNILNEYMDTVLNINE
jgi:hypothetical protein